MVRTLSGTAGKIPLVLLVFCLLIVPVLAVTMERHDNANINGGDYHHDDLLLAGADAMIACEEACLIDASCKAATYVPPGVNGPKAQCWRKNINSPLYSAPGLTIWIKLEDKGSLSVSTSPAGAQIFLNGGSTGYVTPHTFTDLTPGAYGVRVSLAGYADSESIVAVNAGQTAAYTVVLSASQPTTGYMSVMSVPSGATVIVDGVSRGATPTTVSGLAAGTHTVRISLAGYADYEGTWAVNPGQTTQVAVTLASPTTGTLSVTSTPGSANVAVDDVARGKTPLTISGLDPGSHKVTISMSGYIDYITDVQITAGQVTAVSAVLKVGSNTGTIEVSSEPSGASVNLDGWQKGNTPVSLQNVRTGNHELTLSLAGYPDWKQTVTVSSGRTTTVNAVMETSPATGAGTGSLSVATTPAGAQVIVDGVLIGNSPTKSTGLAPGSHTLLLRMEGYQDLSVPITITTGQTTEYSTSLAPAAGAGLMSNRTPGFTAVLVVLALTVIVAGRTRLRR